MLLRHMFNKDIGREIRGVIKVAQDDEETRFQELEEYVVTRELLKRLSLFYQNYQKGIDGYTDEMGVWISGFFGSGKSHFLKILSYLLENKAVKGKKPIELFEDKVADSLVYADMQRAARLPCETILFNIDSKSPMGIKSDKEAILKVFVKVFYDHLGYYGDDLKVAELEKYLKKEGALEKYQDSFASIKGEPWLERRNCFLFDEDAVVEALIKSTGMSEQSSRNWFNHNSGSNISIGQFAREVQEYIESKGDNFHLVFLVDEIGQYIGDNSELMLSLQTVAEDLGVYCKGKAWVIVTSQEDIDLVTNVKGNDFSKIQGRFKTRLSLSSASVDEVIKKRILEKNDFGKDKLSLIYHDNSAVLRNLIHFSEGTVLDLKGYGSEEEFIDTYPFVPYQFRLLQEVFNQIRRHGASGKHLSEGERSMLSAFQDAAKKLAAYEPRVLVPFYYFYDSVHEFLDGSIQRVITRSEESAAQGYGLEPHDVNVLKLLFLIRYIGDIPANLDNIATLMLSSINDDKLSLKTTIKQSLNRLISQNYVQRNADEYRFLTDDEQDVNREIKNTLIDVSLVVDAIGKYIFNDIYDDQKYQYSKRYPIPFNRKIDESNLGNQTARIGLRLLTRASDDYDADEAELKMVSAGNNDLIIRLDDHSDYFEEMQEALKIERFDKIKKQENMPASLKKIVIEKQEEAVQRKKRAKDMLEEAILRGRYYAGGEKIEPTGSTPRERINSGFKLLVEGVYFKLPYVTDFLDSDNDIREILNRDLEQITLMGQSSDPNHLASKEIMSYIELQDAKHLQITMKNLLDKFETDPYGWREIDIAGITARLFKQQKLRLLYQGSYLESKDQNIPSYLRKKTEVEKLIIKKRVSIDEKQLKVARELSKELFNIINLPTDEDGLLGCLVDKFKEKSLELHEKYLSQYQGKKYPGKALIEQGLGLFKEIEQCKNDHIVLLGKLKEYRDQLLDWDEDMRAVEGFFANQRDIFDKGLEMIKRINANRTYLKEEEFLEKTAELQNIIDDPAPYKKIIQIPDLTAWLKQRFEELLQEKKITSRAAVQQDHNALINATDAYGLSEQQQQHYQKTTENWYTDKYCYIDNSPTFERLDAAIVQSANYRNQIQGEIDEAIIRNNESKPEGGAEVIEPAVHVLEYQDIAIKEKLATEQDIDQYIEKLRQKLKKLIKGNKIIQFK